MMILGVCQCNQPNGLPRIMSPFPSADILDGLLHFFLTSHTSQIDSWVHLPSFQINNARPELLASFIAAEAMLSRSPTIWKLGEAINESVGLAVRHEVIHKQSQMLTIANRQIGRNNTLIRDLTTLQTFVVHLDAGLWSGNKRIIEIAESMALIVVTVGIPRQYVVL